ncbi:MAG: hypothetical protein JNL72_14485 [Flavipsychrobacter sp.]|nr:hypothetical protein [Flavipsychrobacter sp.]
MIRKITAFLFCLIIWMDAAAQSLVDTPVHITSLSINLAGKVDSVTEFVMEPSVLEVASNQGVGSDTAYRPDTALQLVEQRALKYDEDGNLLMDVTALWDSRKTQLQEVTATRYAYHKGKVAYCINRKDGSIADSTVYVYTAGRLSMCELYDEKGRYKGRRQFFTNREKILSTISNKDARLELVDMTRLKYNEDRELVEATYHDKDQRLVMTKKYEVDIDSAGHKHVMIFEYAKPDTCTGMESYLLDDMGNHLEDVTQDARGNVLRLTKAAFNEYGHLVTKTSFMKDLDIACYYEYDDHKNWTMKRIYHNGQPYRFVRRVISYYE